MKKKLWTTQNDLIKTELRIEEENANMIDTLSLMQGEVLPSMQAM